MTMGLHDGPLHISLAETLPAQGGTPRPDLLVPAWASTQSHQGLRASLPTLLTTASPSPARVKERLNAVIKPRLEEASIPQVRLSADIFKLAVSRASASDAVLVKAVGELQHAVSMRRRCLVLGATMRRWPLHEGRP